MRNELTDLSCEAWISYLFDHAVRGPQAPPWYLEDEEGPGWWNPLRHPEITVAYLTKLFEHAPRVLTCFSDAQITEGLDFLVSKASSVHLLALFHPDVASPERKRCIPSMYVLFEQFFARRLNHLPRHACPFQFHA